MALTTAQRRAAEEYVRDLVLSQKITVQDDAFYSKIEQATGVKRKMALNMVCYLYGQREARLEMVMVRGKIQKLIARADATQEDVAAYCRQM